MGFCTDCGTQLDVRSRFCTQCGRQAPHICPQCGEVSKGPFCGRCGTGLAGGARGRGRSTGASTAVRTRAVRPLVAVAVVAFFVLVAAAGYAAYRPRAEAPGTYAELIASGNRLMDEGMALADQNKRDAAMKAWRQAVRDFEAALALDASDLHARSDLGLVYVYTGQIDKAEETLSGVVRDDPQYLWAVFNLAWVYRSVGEDLKALELYQRYLDVVETESQLRDKYADHYELIAVQTERARAEVGTLASGPSGESPGGGSR